MNTVFKIDCGGYGFVETEISDDSVMLTVNDKPSKKQIKFILDYEEVEILSHTLKILSERLKNEKNSRKKINC